MNDRHGLFSYYEKNHRRDNMASLEQGERSALDAIGATGFTIVWSLGLLLLGCQKDWTGSGPFNVGRRECQTVARKTAQWACMINTLGIQAVHDLQSPTHWLSNSKVEAMKLQQRLISS